MPLLLASWILGGWGDSQRPASVSDSRSVSSGIGRCCVVCIRVTAKRCVLRYSKMTRSGLRMKIEV